MHKLSLQALSTFESSFEVFGQLFKILLFCFRRGHFSHAQFWSKISEILLCNLKKGLKGQNSGQTFIITEVHIWQAFKRVKIKKSFVTRCTLIWPEFFLKVSCVFIFLLHDLIENPSKISEILLCNLKKGLKGQNSCQTFIITEAHFWQAFKRVKIKILFVTWSTFKGLDYAINRHNYFSFWTTATYYTSS